MTPHSTLTAFGLHDRAQPGEALVWSTPVDQGTNRAAVGIDVGARPDMGRLVAQAAPAILVLTHDDSDHIDGWSGFAPLGLTTLDELWIPYEWAALLDSYDALTHAKAHIDAGISESALAERLRSDFRPASRPDKGGPLWQPALDRDASSVDLDDAALADEVLRFSWEVEQDAEMSTPHTPEFFEGTAEEIAGRVKAKVARLSKILTDATSHGVTVRLFSSDHIKQSSHAHPWLDGASRRLVSIANAIEVEPIMTTRASLSDLAYRAVLSIQNRRALCPVLWHRGSIKGGAVVWSDSSGTWVDRPLGSDTLLDLVDISTAPHHGSNATYHAAAWRALEPFVNRSNTVMLCAGGQWNQGVATPFTCLDRSRRGCTRCRHILISGRRTLPRGSRTLTVATDGRQPQFKDDTCPI